MRPLMLTLGATLLVGAPALIAPDPVLLIAAALGVVFATRARRRRERQSEEGRMAPENVHAVALARWIEEGRQLFTLWQERVERLDELQGRLAATALEIDQLRAQVIYLSQEGEAVRARIGELIQRASEGRPGAGGGAAPAVGP
jgi:uncharacterized protein HemX